jgi:hypothetical protein
MKHLKKFNESSSEWKEGHLIRDFDDEWYVIDSYDKSIPVNSEQSDIFHMDDLHFDDKPCKYKEESGKAFVKLKEVGSPRLD